MLLQPLSALSSFGLIGAQIGALVGLFCGGPWLGQDFVVLLRGAI